MTGKSKPNKVADRWAEGIEHYPPEFKKWAWWFTDISIDAETLAKQWAPLWEQWQQRQQEDASHGKR